MRMVCVLIFCTFQSLFQEIETNFDSVAKETELLDLVKSKLTTTSPPPGMLNNSVFLYLDIYQVVDVDEKDGLISLKLWVYIFYFLEEPLWNENDYNVSMMQFPEATFWEPDISKYFETSLIPGKEYFLL